MDAGEKEPSGFTGCGAFEVFGEPSVTAKPGEGTLDDPSSRQELEAFDAVRSFDDLDRPWPTMSERLFQLVATVDAIREDVLQFGEPTAH